MTITRVAIVRQHRDPLERFLIILFGVGFTFLIAWVLMLIAGTVTDWGLSYWHALLSLIAIRLVQTGSGWMNWTHQAKKGEVK